MKRIIGIDYGLKRVGIAVTDPLQILASGLTTVSTPLIFSFLEEYMQNEEVECIVVGEPLHLDGKPAQIHHLVVDFVIKLRKRFPQIEVVTRDERFTSKEAKRIILQSGAKKKKRRDKSLVDKISAALILEHYLLSIKK